MTRSIKLWAASGVFWLILLVATLVLHRAVSLLVITALFFASSLAQVFYNVRRLRQSIQP